MMEEEIEYFGNFRIDTSIIKYSWDGWSSAVVIDCTKGKGTNGTDTEVICECDEKWAQYICNQLNQGMEKDGE